MGQELATVTPQDTKAILKKATKSGTLAGLKHTEVQSVLNGMYYSIAQALPRHLNPERMIQICTVEITRNPKIAECSVTSLIGAVMQASVLGFSPSPVLGECYFVPYGGKVEFQIGYKGYMKLARKSKIVKQVYAECVYKQDKFEYTLGLKKDMVHVPYLEGDRLDEDIKYVYAVALYKDGTSDFIVLTRKEVEKLRLRNSSQKAIPSGAWSTDYAAMSKAKAVKQLAKWMPSEDSDVDPIKFGAMTDDTVIPMEAFPNNNTGVLQPELLEETTFVQVDDEEPQPVQQEEAYAPKNTGGGTASKPASYQNQAAKRQESQSPTPEQMTKSIPSGFDAADRPKQQPAQQPAKPAARPAAPAKTKASKTLESVCKEYEFEYIEDTVQPENSRWGCGDESFWMDIYSNEDGTFEVLSGTDNENEDMSFAVANIDDLEDLVRRWQSGEVLSDTEAW